MPGSWIGFLRAGHELAKLQVDPDDVGPQLLHLAEVRLDGGPLVFPIVFDEPPLVVVVVVEAPGHEGATGGVEDEPFFVLGNLHPGHLVRLRLGRHATGEGRYQGQRHPIVGHHVFIGTGATVLGPVRVGDYAKIGANASVINHDVPAHSTVVGTPARVVKLHGERVDEPLPRTIPPADAVLVELEV